MEGQLAQVKGATRHLNNLGTLRLVAALLVLFGHSYTLSHPGYSDPLSEGIDQWLPLDSGLFGQGVSIFFVISGYLVTQSYMRRRHLSLFAEARLLRIFPALWVAIGVTVLACSIESTLAPGDFLQSRTTLDYILHTATLTNTELNLPDVFLGNPSPEVNISLWTLPIELGLYALVAVAGVVGLLRHRAVFNLAVLSVFGAYVLSGSELPLMSNRHEAELALFFLAGGALYMNCELVPQRGGLALAALAGAVLLPARDAALIAAVVVVLFAYSIMWIGLATRPRLPDLAARGDASYGTYLYASPVTQLWIAAVGPSSPGLIAALTAVTAIPLGFASWHLIEAPALRQKGRIVGALASGLAFLRPQREPGG